ncbi:hypothetical protein BMF94_2437 [Rhodotorula taiwanensis]|uniref:Protein YTP1-like C-terminal domain-containing protein n=1 Tax=Rhodotorula taiwanensis TaxID=741276 RepID=A0A2S5BD18_9BASI|nr:hypothetical protein BMF94_2437 [Rhodotorula taiwanensis]
MTLTRSGRARPCSALTLLSLVVFSTLLTVVAAHDHHETEDVGPYEHNFTNDEPLDSVIQWHIGIQIFCWGILFPVGMILGMTRSRFHVPVQSIGIVLSLAGNFLGHHHAGRSFHMTAHAHFASYLWWYMISQAAMGVFLKLHVLEGSRVRKGVVVAHGIVGKSFPVVGWVQMIFGGIAALGYCFGDHLGQCLAHFIMGSAFIGYALILLIMLRLGAGFLARHKMSQEYLDSWVIMLWGIVNTFTEHNFLAAHPTGWSHKDMQHVSLGVLWWAGGALGIFLGRKGTRNIVPAIIIGMTGYAMANHGQHLEFSTDVHKLFGYSLMLAALARIVEVCFVLRDQATSESGRPRAWQHLPPYLLILSGLTFLSATEEQMQWVAGSGMDSTTYANILFSGAFAIYLVGNGLVEIYLYQTAGKDEPEESFEANMDVEDGGSGVGIRGRTRYRSTGAADQPTRGPGGLAAAIPAAIAGAISSLSQAIRSPNASRGLFGPAQETAASSRRHEQEMAQYEQVPLTSSTAATAAGAADGRRTVDDVGSGRRRGGESGALPLGSDETVFDVGDFQDDDDDDGGDGYWQDKEDEDSERQPQQQQGGLRRTARI